MGKVGKSEKNLKLEKEIEKKVSFLEKKFGFNTDTEIGPWFRFRFPIPKLGFGCTLIMIAKKIYFLIFILSIFFTKRIFLQKGFF